ncbi:MAG: ECF subfamily RNA polymerase sigma-70 factor [Idiomarinaceae bacterium HL-53]|nr:MAG: ECF subfamily RNA polymerase sigma-70 factor [Idiomarinaceae bacterium HL-53]CUS47348.1 RNA polymerase sigma-70 factor, ECF subfamily [Idiomarinaceae bacterium HL-53]
MALSKDQENEHIVREYWPRMLRAAACYELNMALREELAQEMAVEVWRALSSFSQQCSLNTYVYRVMHNVAVDHIRRSRRQPPTQEADDLWTDDTSPEHVLVKSQQQAQLVAALQKIPLSFRQSLMLKLEGMSNIEIAETLGLTESNVGVRLNRGKQMLAKLLGSKAS